VKARYGDLLAGRPHVGGETGLQELGHVDALLGGVGLGLLQQALLGLEEVDESSEGEVVEGSHFCGCFLPFNFPLRGIGGLCW